MRIWTSNQGSAKPLPLHGRRLVPRRLGVRAVTVAALVLVEMSSVGEADRLLGLGRVVAKHPVTRCRPMTEARTLDYLEGRACPPQDFARVMGYRPVWGPTPGGWRYTKPAWANGHCTGPIGNTGPFWDFTLACQTHDYGYDLVRFGVGTRADIDRLLYHDMLASCERWPGLNGVACRAIAASARSVLKVGEVMRTGPPRGSARRRPPDPGLPLGPQVDMGSLPGRGGPS